ncbi:glycosyltransferase [Colwellia piezophila]|uniref:glycosyltransferase n=1 Tax=Colwellia piezophila TaxID=211668 RepID=UPI00037BC1F7|nr:glycosyltransferase [Colwellia piezophila]
MKNVLMVALELPPCRSAGVQRTLRFSEYLPRFSWQPHIISATDNIYERRDDTLTILPEVAKYVVKAKCADAAKKYAIKGRYFQWMTLPDRYWPWYFDAVKQASKVIDKEKPDVLWSTYPVLTAHWIARKLQKKYNIPWVADFRDPLQCRYDQSAQRYAWLKKWMERSIIKHADKVVFTSNRAAALYRELYPNQDPNKFITIENGYYLSEELSQSTPLKREKFQLLYSGSLYANGRDPKQLFLALALLKKQGVISPDNFILTFRPGKKDAFQTLLAELAISELVEFLPSTSFDGAVAEMQQSSATVLIQDDIFHRQIPGKIYDYISAKRPILAITPRNSATADLVVDLLFGTSVWGVNEIATGLKFMLENNIDCSADIEQYSRKEKTQELVNIFNKIICK